MLGFSLRACVFANIAKSRESLGLKARKDVLYYKGTSLERFKNSEDNNME